MKEIDVITENMIKIISSEVIEEIIENTEYFDDVEDISNQLNTSNTMVFDVFMTPELMDEIHKDLSMRDRNTLMENLDEGVSKRLHSYIEIALADILSSIEDMFFVENVTTSYIITDMDGGISIFLYFYFADYYLH